MRASTPPGAAGVRIKELPVEERPRERLWQHGAAVLSTTELLAILIGTGHRATAESAVELARRLLSWARVRDGGSSGTAEGVPLRRLASARPEELCEVPGIGPAKAVRIVAALELGRRMAALAPRRRRVQHASDVVALLHEEMRYLPREQLRAVMLSTKHHILAVDTVSEGGFDATIVDPREVFRTALQRHASAVILVHNHPSGDPTPSPDDLEVTRRLLAAGRMLDIEVLDHIVLGDRCYVSIRDLHPEWFG
ncbi:MAG TPA: DNA repair protein RadC [Bacillota bacterium]